MTKKRRMLKAAQSTAGAGAVAALLLGCGSGDPAASAPPRPGGGDTSGVSEYVGTIPGTEYFIAFATGPAGDVEAYLCDGRGGAALFNGRVENGRLALQPGGAWNNPGAWDAATDLQGTVSDTAVDGTVVLAGQPRSFRADQATGAGGLYTTTTAVESQRQVDTATSERGNALEITQENGRLSGTFTPPNGEAQTLGADQFRPPPGASGPPIDVYTGYRWVMLDSLEVRGKKLSSSSTTGGKSGGDTGYTSRDIDP